MTICKHVYVIHYVGSFAEYTYTYLQDDEARSTRSVPILSMNSFIVELMFYIQFVILRK